MLRCIHGVGWGHVNVQVRCIRCRCYVAYMGWGVHVKLYGRNSGVRQNLGFTQKNFATHFECSTVVPGCHALAGRACSAMIGCGTGGTGSRAKDPMF